MLSPISCSASAIRGADLLGAQLWSDTRACASSTVAILRRSTTCARNDTPASEGMEGAVATLNLAAMPTQMGRKLDRRLEAVTVQAQHFRLENRRYAFAEDDRLFLHCSVVVIPGGSTFSLQLSLFWAFHIYQ